MAITQTLTALPTAPQSTDTPEIFNSRADAFVLALYVDFQPEMNVAIGQINGLQTELNTLQTEVNTARDTTLSYRDQTLTARNLAYASANFVSGGWDTTTDFANKSVIHNGVAYVSNVSPNINNDPELTVGTEWIKLSVEDFIEVLFAGLNENINIPITVTANNDIDTITYTSGNTKVYTYTASFDIETIKYYDTDGTTLLATLTNSYIVDDVNNFPYGVWS